MSDDINNKPSTAYWIIAATLLAWNLLGLYMYYGQSTATPESFASAGYSADQVNCVMAEPVWAHAAYAIAVNAGVLGAILLLLRKAWAVPLFVLSLIGALLQDLDAYVLRSALDYFDAVWLTIPIVVLVICVFEIWYSNRAKSKGWLS
jgi:hypothetical protein